MIRNHIHKSYDPKRRASLSINSDGVPLLGESLRRRSSLFTPTGPHLTVPPICEQRRSSFPGLGSAPSQFDGTRRRSSSNTPEKNGTYPDVDSKVTNRSFKLVLSTIGVFLVIILVYSFFRLVA